MKKSAGMQKPLESFCMEAREARASGNNSTDRSDVDSDRMLKAMEKSLELTQERMRRDEARAKVEETQAEIPNVDRRINTIKAMLDESDDLMDDQEKKDLCLQLLALLRKSLAMSVFDGSGAG